MFRLMTNVQLASVIQEVCWQGTKQFPVYLFWAREGMLPPEECSGPTGTGSGGSLSAKQSIQETDGRGMCPGGGYT